MAKLILTNSSGDMDITNMVATITWGGDYNQCARTLDFGILATNTDINIDYVECELGQVVRLFDGDTLLFFGYVFARDRSTDGNTVDVKCFDRGVYLNRNKASYNFTGATPESITAKICGDFGISTAAVAQTGIGVSRVFLGCGLYEIIMTAYTEAAKKNGEKYIIRFDGEHLNVFKKQVTQNAVRIESGVNLMTANYSESIENMINRVAIYDKDDNFVKYVANEEYIRLYGLMQEYVKQTEKENKFDEADKLLKDNGIERKISVENIGDTRCITGQSVIVREPYTGLYGSFFIDSDVHTWKNGMYLNKLTLNFENIMDEKEAGNLPKEEE